MKTFQTTATVDEQGRIHIDVPDAQPGETVELVVRIGPITSRPTPSLAGPPYTRPVSLGGCLLDNIDNIEEVFSLVEGEEHK